MGAFSLLNPAIYIDATDMTGFVSKATLHPTVDEKEVTTFGSGGFRARLGGLRTVDFSAEGYMDSAAVPDIELWGNLGLKDNPISICPQGAETNTAFFFLDGETEYDQFGQIGDPAPFMISGKNTNSQGLVRGQLAALKQSKSATGQLGSILTLTGPLAGQFLYAIVHCFSPVGTTVTIQIQSSTVIGFGAPTTRATFPAITAVGGYWLTRVAGPFTDGFWRLNISAITGTFILAGAIGVGS